MCWNFHLIFLLSSALVRSLVPYCFWNLHKCRFSNYWFFSSRFCFFSSLLLEFLETLPAFWHVFFFIQEFYWLFSLKDLVWNHSCIGLFYHIFKLGHLTPASAFLSHFTEVIESEEHLRSVEVGMEGGCLQRFYFLQENCNEI